MIHHPRPKSFQSCTVIKHHWCRTKYMTTTLLDSVVWKKYKIFIKRGEIYYMRTTIWQLILWKVNSFEEKKITFIISQHTVFWETEKIAQFTGGIKLKMKSTTMYKHQTYQHHKVQMASDLYVLNLSSSFVPIARLSLIHHEFCHQTQVGWQISICTDMDLQGGKKT